MAEKCCFLGDHKSLPAIEKEVREGKLSVREVARRFTISRGSLQKHLLCMGIFPKPKNADPPSEAGPTANTEAGRSQTTSVTANATPLAFPDKSVTKPMVPGGMRSSAAFLLSREEDQIDYIADLIECGQFYFRRTLVWLERAWNLPADAVRARFQLAVERCSADRQHEIAQKEATLAALEGHEYEAMREFRRLRRNDPTAARAYLGIALKARTEYSNLAGLKTIRHDVNINVWQRTEFIMAVDQFTEAALDVVAPVDASHLLASVQGRLPDASPEVLEALPEILDVVLAQLQGDAAKRFSEIATQNGQTPSLPMIEGSGDPLAAE